VSKIFRKMGPLAADHPAVGEVCTVCCQPIAAGDFVTLLLVGPADDDDAWKAAAGLAHTAQAVVIHWLCCFRRGI
jgi:hypothetical protein